ncbi:hypothetical protein K435DRAFT_799476 [Dendrothele bispora CBS 962.96]|uniref:Uncharacterized protein n=1 Tax=Dendrothele bispora (strain CBS 962.96) TaxID=1314807 RepID=A0A4V4HF64_DENBC|nr:hypothetical protein K435DRAFT_799476 [Dendrothele bispora CBS 962.96]
MCTCEVKVIITPRLVHLPGVPKLNQHKSQCVIVSYDNGSDPSTDADYKGIDNGSKKCAKFFLITDQLKSNKRPRARVVNGKVTENEEQRDKRRQTRFSSAATIPDSICTPAYFFPALRACTVVFSTFAAGAPQGGAFVLGFQLSVSGTPVG